MKGPREKPAKARSYKGGWTHVNFTADEMRELQAMRDALSDEIGVTFNSTRQALLVLTRRYLRSKGAL